MSFQAGDKVMWSHTLPSVYGKGVVLKASAVQALDRKAVPCTVVGLENKQGTLVRVKLEAASHPDTKVALDASKELVLTSDELVKVEEA
jgi:hypothetical protein